MGVKNMLEEKLVNIPIISVSKTSGLTSANQLVDNTSNEIFSLIVRHLEKHKKLG